MTTEQYDRESEIESIVKLILQESQKSAFIEKIKFKIEQDYQGGSLRVIFGNENKNNIMTGFMDEFYEVSTKQKGFSKEV